MSRLLKIVEISDSGSVDLGTLQSGEVAVGRSADADLSLDSSAVSFEHGIFARMRNHWFYKDLGSTNGSFLNGVRARPEHWLLVRSGDTMQIGDVVVQFVPAENSPEQSWSGFPALGGKTLLVFRRGELADEFPVPDYGKALIIGGMKGDLDLAESTSSDAVFTIEKKDDHLFGYSDTGLNTVPVNGTNASVPLDLFDRDEVLVGEYVIVVNDPSGPASPRMTSSETSLGQEIFRNEANAGEPSSSYPPRDTAELSLGGGWNYDAGSSDYEGSRGGSSAPIRGFGKRVSDEPQSVPDGGRFPRSGGDVPQYRGSGAPAKKSFFQTVEGRLVIGTLVLVAISVAGVVAWMAVR
jgi:hypothetical protein